MIEISVVMTAYNEEPIILETATQMLQTLSSLKDDWELVLVDNGSRDKTTQIMDQLAQQHAAVRVVHVPDNQGYGHGVRQGINACQGRFVSYVPADGQIDEKIIAPMLEKAKNNEADLLIASRIIRHDNPWRRFTSRMFNLLMSTFFKTSISDVNGEPKLFTRKMWDDLSTESQGSFLDAELVIKAQAKGLRLLECPMLSPSRRGGISKVSLWWNVHFLKNILIYYFSGRIADYK